MLVRAAAGQRLQRTSLNWWPLERALKAAINTIYAVGQGTYEDWPGPPRCQQDSIHRMTLNNRQVDDDRHSSRRAWESMSGNCNCILMQLQFEPWHPPPPPPLGCHLTPPEAHLTLTINSAVHCWNMSCVLNFTFMPASHGKTGLATAPAQIKRYKFIFPKQPGRRCVPVRVQVLSHTDAHTLLPEDRLAC